MTALKLYVGFAWGVIAFSALCFGVAYQSAAAFRIVLMLVPAWIVFVWWSIDRAALERRISRLEARTEIADLRRVDTQTGLQEVGRQLHAIEARVTETEGIEHRP